MDAGIRNHARENSPDRLGDIGGPKSSMGMKVKSFPNPNVIQQNFNQGILVVEGSHAKIIANKIDSNIKANIALGGRRSGNTRIKYNYIEHSKSEGIFVTEGEPGLVVEDNQIEQNSDGVVLVNSDGQVRHNQIKQNTRSGVLTAGKTTATLFENTIEDSSTGILIKDPSEPRLRNNMVQKNNVQVEMERQGGKNLDQIRKDNPKIVGQCLKPSSTCNIF